MPGTAPANVLVVGIDGVRYDTMREVETPALDVVAARGFLRPVRVNDSGPTISGPCWSTITTGVLPPVHGVFDNTISPHNLRANHDFLHRARTDLGAATFATATWPPLVTDASGGPILTDGGLLPGGGAATTEAELHVADQEGTDAAVEFLGRGHDDRPVAAFVYYLGCDAMCHAFGVGDTYRRYIEASDRRLGELIAAVDARIDSRGERWVVIVVTDHGHLDPGGHGGDSEEERTAWIGAFGAGVPVPFPQDAVLEQADVAGHALAQLGLEPESGDVVGLPFGERVSAATPA